MQVAKWEDQFRRWSGPASNTEDEKRDRTEDAIREAIEESPELTGRTIRVFAKGSYKNNTNVRLDSDVDVAVEFQEIFYYSMEHALEGMSGADFGITPYLGYYPPERFKDDVELALAKHFGGPAVDRGDKAIHVREDSRSLSADVVPCFTFRRFYDRGYNATLRFHEGIQIHSDSGSRIENWPQQSYDNGTAKNTATGRRYKKVVRTLKRLENDMVEKGIIDEVPSFLIECLVYNVPNEGFQHDTYLEDVSWVLAHVYNETLNGGGWEEWVEVNELKWLFRQTQKWTRTQAHNFASEAWGYVGFE